MNDKDRAVIDFFESEICDSELLEALKEYWANRKELKKPLTVRAAKMALKKLDEMANGNTSEKIKIVQQSVFYGWIGLFPVKATDTTKHRSNRTSTNQFLQMLKEAQYDEGGDY